VFVYLFESKHVSLHLLLIKGWQQVVCTHDTGPKSFIESLFKHLPAKNVHTLILWKTSSQQTSVLVGKKWASFKQKNIVYVNCAI
jgi:hypothetical protein